MKNCLKGDAKKKKEKDNLWQGHGKKNIVLQKSCNAIANKVLGLSFLRNP
jgi:hypothetical protein